MTENVKCFCFMFYKTNVTSGKGREKGGRKAPCLLCLVYLHASMRGTGMKRSSKKSDFVERKMCCFSEPRTATDRMCPHA